MTNNSCIIVICSFFTFLHQGCTHRSLGSSNDGGRDDPDGGCGQCLSPYVCDTTTNQCVCPPQTCCELVDCFCGPEDRFCQGADLTACEPRDVWWEDGMCGSICEYPVLMHCEHGCVSESGTQARCIEGPDPCGEQSNGSFNVTMLLSGGGEYSCYALDPDFPEIDLEARGVLMETEENSFKIRTNQWEADVIHNLPWYVGNCLWPGQEIRVRARWSNESGWFCTQRLAVFSGETLLVYAQDGDMDLFVNVPFQVHLHDLGCTFPPDGWCEDPATHAMDFSFNDEELVRIHQGEIDHAAHLNETYEMANLRSYISGLCDDYWNYAFYVLLECGDAFL